MKYTAIYRDNGQSVVREKATMNEPVCQADIENYGNKDYWTTYEAYKKHLASLKEYPASWVTKEMDGQDVECRLQCQVHTGWTWDDCSKEEYEAEVHNHSRRIIAVPVVEKKKLIGASWCSKCRDYADESCVSNHPEGIEQSRLVPVVEEKGVDLVALEKKIDAALTDESVAEYIKNNPAPVEQEKKAFDLPYTNHPAPPVSVEKMAKAFAHKEWSSEDANNVLTFKVSAIIEMCKQDFIAGHAAALASGGQDAVRFAEWLGKNNYWQIVEQGKHTWMWGQIKADATTAELYQLFLNNKTEVK